jgi:hypothetical protein
MRPFAPESWMFTLGGVFYPTGHMFLMFPTAEDAMKAGRMLAEAGFDGGSLFLLTPKDVHDKIWAGVGHVEGLPSPGTEAETARHFEELARAGHHALLVPAPKARDAEQVMEALRDANISCAQRYRHWVIEDIVT